MDFSIDVFPWVYPLLCDSVVVSLLLVSILEVYPDAVSVSFAKEVGIDGCTHGCVFVESGWEWISVFEGDGVDAVAWENWTWTGVALSDWTDKGEGC